MSAQEASNSGWKAIALEDGATERAEETLA